MEPPNAIHRQLIELCAHGTPALRGFAAWVLDNLPLVAFNSIRGLAKQAEVNPNTVTRLAKELGYAGFDAFRVEVQTSLQSSAPSYAARARALRSRDGDDVFTAVIDANRQNTAAIFSTETLELLESCIAPLLSARKIHTVGVRSCYAIAHYFSYVGGMAFDNFVEMPSLPGAIIDQMSQVGPDDIVMGITYEHYSAEVVQACEIARSNGARVLALTDSHTSPIALGAWKTLRLPMAGPHFMPSLNSAFLAVEMLLTGMAAQSDGAAKRVAAFESRIRQFGGYTGTAGPNGLRGLGLVP
jgi:DNA-binding MurR/RpiR family transcriptional regulator